MHVIVLEPDSNIIPDYIKELVNKPNIQVITHEEYLGSDIREINLMDVIILEPLEDCDLLDDYIPPSYDLKEKKLLKYHQRNTKMRNKPHSMKKWK